MPDPIKPTPEEMGQELLDVLYFTKVKECNIPRALALINAGARLDMDRGRDGTALHIAARHGHAECIEALLKAGAEINRQDHYGNSPLMCASSNLHSDCVKLLIEAGTDLEIKNNNDYTALMQAAHTSFSKIESLRLLISAGAEVNHKNAWGKTALDLAIQHKQYESAKLLREALVRQEEKEKLAQEKFLRDTDFRRGLAEGKPATKPLKIKKNGMSP
jgi:ankyrin repeat protein